MQPTAALWAGVEPATARSITWCSVQLSYHEPASPRFRSPARDTPWPTVRRRGGRAAGPARPAACLQRDAGGSRTHFNRVAAGRLAVWLQRRTFGPNRCPRQESNLALDLRTVACSSNTLQGRELSSMPSPGVEPGPRPSEGRVRSVTPRGLTVPPGLRPRRRLFNKCSILVPTLRVGTPGRTLRVHRDRAGSDDAERRGGRSHAERGNELCGNEFPMTRRSAARLRLQQVPSGIRTRASALARR